MNVQHGVDFWMAIPRESKRALFLQRLKALSAGARSLGFLGIAQRLTDMNSVLEAGETTASDLAAIEWALGEMEDVTHGRLDAHVPEATPAAPPATVCVVGGSTIESLLRDGGDVEASATVFASMRVDDPRRVADKLGACAPDLFVVDVDVPGALDLVRDLADDPRTDLVPVVTVGGIGESIDAAQLAAFGVLRAFAKPFDARALRATCVEAVEQRRGRTIRMVLPPASPPGRALAAPVQEDAVEVDEISVELYVPPSSHRANGESTAGRRGLSSRVDGHLARNIDVIIEERRPDDSAQKFARTDVAIELIDGADSSVETRSSRVCRDTVGLTPPPSPVPVTPEGESTEPFSFLPEEVAEHLPIFDVPQPGVRREPSLPASAVTVPPSGPRARLRFVGAAVFLLASATFVGAAARRVTLSSTARESSARSMAAARASAPAFVGGVALPPEGLVEIAAAEGASIFVDGAERGRGPRLSVTISEGAHEVRASGTGVPKQVDVVRGRVTHVDLLPAGASLGRSPVLESPPRTR